MLRRKVSAATFHTKQAFAAIKMPKPGILFFKLHKGIDETQKKVGAINESKI